MRSWYPSRSVRTPCGKTRTASRVTLGALAICLLACGCSSLTRSSLRTVFAEPRQFCDSKDLVRTKKQNRRLAQDASRETETRLPDCAVSADYVDGFREGFADFLDYGGNGLPPVLPPRRYWRAKRRSAANRQAAQEWFDGFAHGTTAARQSGLRELATVPVSFRLAPAPPPVVGAPLQHEVVPEVRSMRRLPAISTESSAGEPMRTAFVQSRREGEAPPPRLDPNRWPYRD